MLPFETTGEPEELFGDKVDEDNEHGDEEDDHLGANILVEKGFAVVGAVGEGILQPT